MNKVMPFHSLASLLRLLSVLGLALILLLNLWGGDKALPPAAAQTPSGQKVLVAVEEKETLQRLAASGAILLEEYEAFSLWRVTSSQLARARNSDNLQPQPEFDQIPLRGGQVIQTSPGQAVEPTVAAPLRQKPSQEPELWLVQFIGPIKPEWLDSLSQKTGLELVGYLPNNAYIVWGPAAHERLAELAQANSFIQWTGPYHPAYRLAPDLHQAATHPADEPVEVTVQFYTTPQVSASLGRLQTLGGVVIKNPEQILAFTNITLPLPAGRLVEVANWPDG